MATTTFPGETNAIVARLLVLTVVVMMEVMAVQGAHQWIVAVVQEWAAHPMAWTEGVTAHQWDMADLVALQWVTGVVLEAAQVIVEATVVEAVLAVPQADVVAPEVVAQCEGKLSSSSVHFRL